MPEITKQATVTNGLKDESVPLLDVNIDSHKVTRGERIPRAKYQRQLFSPHQIFPRIALTRYSASDLDVPFGSFNFLSPIVHWLQTGFKVDGPKLKSNDPAVAPRFGAGPPPGAAPHRYLFLLHDEKPDLVIPANWKGKELTHMQRMRFDVVGCEKLLGLGNVQEAN